MAAELIGGPIKMTGSVDAEGHREYKVIHRVMVDETEGPAVAMECEGLPEEGTEWSFQDDEDLWAWCLPSMTCTPYLGQDSGPNKVYLVEQTFSSKSPEEGKQRCNDTKIEDPLLEPYKISGHFTKDHEEVMFDRFGRPIMTSSFELVRGKNVEFDTNRPVIKIEMNVPILALDIYSALVDCVNDSPLWLLPKRCWKLSNVSFDRKFYGRCSVYYTIGLEFEGNRRTWDRDILDEGTKVLKGHWDRATGKYVLDRVGGEIPNPWNPQHFVRYTDPQGNPGRVVLNGRGLPAGARVRNTRIQVVGQGFGGFDEGFWVGEPQSIAGTWRRMNADGTEAPQGQGAFGFQTATPHGFQAGQSLLVSDVVGPDATLLNTFWTVTEVPEPTVIRLGATSTIVPEIGDIYIGGQFRRYGDIVFIDSYVTPIVVTSDLHGLSTGNRISITGVVNAIGINGSWLITKIDASRFSLNGSTATSFPGTGTIYEDQDTQPAYIHVERYPSANFLLLGIPLNF